MLRAATSLLPLTSPHAPTSTRSTTPAALAVFRLPVSDPPVHETLTFLLDHDGRGGTIVAVSGTTAPPEALFLMGACMARRDREACSLVVATVRPDDVVVATSTAGPQPRSWLIRRHRARRMVRDHAGRRRRAPSVDGRARTLVTLGSRARRSAGLSRRPAERSARTRSRLGVSTAPAAISSSRNSSGTS